jgi:hypothetical protein
MTKYLTTKTESGAFWLQLDTTTQVADTRPAQRTHA